jgi:hypothetical protein
MHLKALLAALAATLTIVPAQAQETGGSSASKPSTEKKVCKRAIATGSVMTKVICRTKAEWNAISEQSQSDLDRTRDLDRARSHTMNSNN